MIIVKYEYKVMLVKIHLENKLPLPDNKGKVVKKDKQQMKLAIANLQQLTDIQILLGLCYPCWRLCILQCNLLNIVTCLFVIMWRDPSV